MTRENHFLRQLWCDGRSIVIAPQLTWKLLTKASFSFPTIFSDRDPPEENQVRPFLSNALQPTVPIPSERWQGSQLAGGANNQDELNNVIDSPWESDSFSVTFAGGDSASLSSIGHLVAGVISLSTAVLLTCTLTSPGLVPLILPALSFAVVLSSFIPSALLLSSYLSSCRV